MKKSFKLQKIGEKRYSLDVRGYVCPYPQLLTMRALESLSSYDILEVILDNLPSVRDIPPAIKEKGFEVLTNQSRVTKGTWKMSIQA